MASIVITEGPRAGERIEVDAELTLGRAGAEITIDDSEVSRRHAVVRPAGQELEIEDLGSTNGTWVNQARIAAPTRLRNGDVVRLGTTSITVEVTGIPDAALTVPAQAAVAAPTQQVAAKEAPPATAVPAAAAEPAPPAAQPAAPPPAPAPAAAAPPPAAAVLIAAPSSPPAFGESRRRRRSVASRQLFPIVFCFVAIVATAVALVLYFAFR